jgi:chromate transporter
LKKGFRFYWTLFISTFTLSAFTFGGGYVIVPLMRKKFVEKLHLITDEEMLDLVALGQSAPGALAVNTSILVGYHTAGVPGALLTVLGTVLPPLITLTVISLGYEAFKGNTAVRFAFRGMQAGVAALVCSAVAEMALPIFKKRKWGPIALMAAAFALAAVFKVNVVLIILACGLIGLLDAVKETGALRKAGKKK